jgi:hypothetical protein
MVHILLIGKVRVRGKIAYQERLSTGTDTAPRFVRGSPGRMLVR